MVVEPNLAVNVGGIRMKNPVMTASGCYGHGLSYLDFYSPSLLGAIVVKGLYREPWKGNAPPRIAETPAGMLNAVGLEGPGVEAFLENELPELRRLNATIIVNVAGHTVEEYAEIARRLNDEEGVSGLELNISCPNVGAGGMAFGVDPAMVFRVVSEVRAVTRLPVIAKLSPNVTDIRVTARAAEEAGADAVSAINTLLGMAIDVRTRRPRLANITGGLSGPAIRPVAVRMVWQVAQTVRIPVVGQGGIATAEDAIEFMLAGATAVAVGTANFVNPMAPVEIIEGVSRYLAENGISDVTDLVGKVEIE